MPEKPITRYNRKSVYTGRSLELVVDEVLWPNKKRLKRDLILHRGISVILPVIGKNQIVMIKQYRYGAGETLWEIPAGTMDKGETPLETAKREIQEEIGYKAKTWKKIISFYPCPGFSTEIIHTFVASNLVKTECALESDEILEAHVFSFKKVAAMIKAKKIRDAKSLVPLFYFLKEKKLL